MRSAIGGLATSKPVAKIMTSTAQRWPSSATSSLPSTRATPGSTRTFGWASARYQVFDIRMRLQPRAKSGVSRARKDRSLTPRAMFFLPAASRRLIKRGDFKLRFSSSN